MKIITNITEIKENINIAKAEGKTIGFVPTMGFFHKGHLELMRRAKSDNDVVVVSVFINPAQFLPGEDLDKYPRDFDRDKELAASVGVDFLFAPTSEEIYPANHQTWLEIEKLSNKLCGKTRPGHFRGVATIVAKFFNIVRPNKAYFGLKDYQQFIIIKQMVKDLNFDLGIIGVPIIRDDDGIATSSRNIYLAYDERQEALVLYVSLKKAQRLLGGGIKNAEQIKKAMIELIEIKNLVKLEYLEIVDVDNLMPVENIKNEALVAIAAKIGKARLIDNMVIKCNE